ncbi:PIF1-like protein [Mya arenaria]|uniref:PIF1-like protein n=1 Tax=Mya arenaria TaxID=6604 RepID=A0ABY7FBN9_MYAAR|nr:PIF1-like protein [Mya arenaria]
MFSHKIVLNDNVRTKDEQLMKLITEVFSGGISADSEKFLASLKRPLPVYQASDSIKLFAKNDLVDDFNRTSLLDYPGDLYQFKSTDSEDISGIRTIPAPEILWVKVGCPVILLQNLSDKLVNGLVGRIHSISVETGPVVEFATIVFNPALNTNIAEREQYPLKPAFGLTIHKAQGIVEIDCQEIFRPGQLGIALSRATNSHGLRVINFHQRYLIKPPALITEFMRKESAEILQSPGADYHRSQVSTAPGRDDQARHVATGPGGDDQARQVATGPGGDDQARHVATGPGGDDRARHVATAPGGDDQERHIYPEIHTAQKVDLLGISSGHVSRRYVTTSSHARVRYVAGYCVSKLRKKYVDAKKSKLFSTSEEGHNLYHEAKCKFFISLTESLLHLIIYENLLKFGKDLYAKCYEQVYKNEKLCQNFIDIVSKGYSSERIQKMDASTNESFYVGDILDDIVLESSQILIVYTELVNKFLRVLVAQFRKDVKSSCKLDKRMAHRKQIKVSTSGKKLKLKQKQPSPSLPVP